MSGSVVVEREMAGSEDKYDVVVEREMAGSEDKYDVVVVGAGMFGSSAAKYLCQTSPHLRVALIGLGEPEDRADTEVTTVNNQRSPVICLVSTVNQTSTVH